jgi:hypothetical protein
LRAAAESIEEGRKRPTKKRKVTHINSKQERDKKYVLVIKVHLYFDVDPRRNWLYILNFFFAG